MTRFEVRVRKVAHQPGQLPLQSRSKPGVSLRRRQRHQRRKSNTRELKRKRDGASPEPLETGNGEPMVVKATDFHAGLPAQPPEGDSYF
jgi:hypothetical protein